LRPLFLVLIFLFSFNVHADVVKPALIEITANTNGTVSIEVRASIEALLTGINSRYKNTQDAPNAEEYDELRELVPEALQPEFEPFKDEFISKVKLKADGDIVPLKIANVDIPPRGYTKVPRISVITLEGKLDRTHKQLEWYYPQAFGDNAVRVRQIDEVREKWHWSEYQWIREDSFTTPFQLDALFTKQPFFHVVRSYISIGYDHIIPLGLDHILFIVGLFFLSNRFKPLLGQVTMFTVAHTITLGLAVSGYISIPAKIVEPLIALSIAYVAIENIFMNRLHKGRLILVFFFGLLHGIGFADALADFGMPNGEFLTALISFNIGVELGQLAVLGLTYLAVIFAINRPWYRHVIVIPASITIAFIAIYWMIERIEWV
jgi:hypothetical protein